jgi:DNA processing protein
MREPLTEIREQRLALFSVVAVGNAFWSQQIQEFGIESVYQNLFFGVYNGEKFGKMITEVNAFDSEQALQNICNSGGVFLTPEEEKWPKQVSSLSNPPIGLVVKGNVEILKNKSLAIVGTRNPTPYGIRIAGDFAAGFVDREWNIVSGGAYGIDSAAHKGALIAEGRTIAVLATGVDVAYPAGNVRLFAEIAENGALVSEVMPGAHAIPVRFLNRNRIIAALSQATLVVEAAFRSGSLRTARDAAELMRPVMAIPGPINAPTSEGCHRLIGERAAEIVTSVSDAIELISSL